MTLKTSAALVAPFLLSGCLFGSGGAIDAFTDTDDRTDDGIAEMGATPDAGGDTSGDDVATGDVGPTDTGPDEMDVASDMPPDDVGTDTGPEDMGPPEPTTVVNSKDVVVDADGCTTAHCSLPEAITAASLAVENGDAGIVSFDIPASMRDDEVLGTPLWRIMVDETLVVDESIAINGPASTDGFVVVGTSDLFGDVATNRALLRVESGNVEVTDLALFGSGDRPVVDVDTMVGDAVNLERLIIANGAVGLLARSGYTLATDVAIGLPLNFDPPTGIGGNVIGIGVGDGARLELADSLVAANEGHGIYVAPGGGDVRIETTNIGVRNNQGFGNGGHGIVLRRGNVVVSENRIADNGLAGIAVDAGTSSEPIAIRGNRIGLPTPNGTRGIDVAAAGDIVIGTSNRDEACTAPSGCNAIANHPGAGIQLSGVTRADIFGNDVGWNPTNGSRAGNQIGIAVQAETTSLKRGDAESCLVGADCDSGTCALESIDPSTWTVQRPGGECVQTCPDTATCSTGARAAARKVAIGPITAPPAVPTTCTGPCNSIVDSQRHGIIAGVDGGAPDDLTIRANFVGLAADGATAAGNRGSGINLTEATQQALIGSNVIAANFGDGIRASGVIVNIRNNHVGIDGRGDTALGNGQNTSGNGIAFFAERGDIIGNTISDNGDAGIRLQSTPAHSDVRIVDNQVGASSDGQTPLGNFGAGIIVSQCDDCLIRGNLIIDNGQDGVWLGGQSQMDDYQGVVADNVLGLTTNEVPAGNAGNGFVLGSVRDTELRSNEIHHSLGSVMGVPGAGIKILGAIRTGILDNTIANNDGAGIDAISPAEPSATWTRNVIEANGSPILLRLPGEPDDATDEDVGPNHGLNTPTLVGSPTAVTENGNSFWRVDLTASAWESEIELYESDAMENLLTWHSVCVGDPTTSDPVVFSCELAPTSSHVVAVQMARRYVLGFDNSAGSPSATFHHPSRSDVVITAGGSSNTERAQNFADEIATQLDGLVIVGTNSNTNCGHFGFTECVDLTVGFATEIQSPNGLTVMDAGPISSEASAPILLP